MTSTLSSFNAFHHILIFEWSMKKACDQSTEDISFRCFLGPRILGERLVKTVEYLLESFGLVTEVKVVTSLILPKFILFLL